MAAPQETLLNRAARRAVEKGHAEPPKPVTITKKVSEDARQQIQDANQELVALRERLAQAEVGMKRIMLTAGLDPSKTWRLNKAGEFESN